MKDTEINMKDTEINMKDTEINTSLNMGALSKYRNIIYGVAICSIVIFHYLQGLMKTDSVFAPLAKVYDGCVGSMGVDVFLIMSGISMYYSLSNSFEKGEFDLLSFYLKRIKRILVPYVLVAIPYWYIVDIALKDDGIIKYIKDISFITFFTEGNRSIWYIVAILLIYLLCPFIYLIFDKLDRVRLIVFMTFVVAICCANWLMCEYKYFFYSNIEIMLTRIPAFILGMYIGKRVIEKVHINRFHKICVIIFACMDLFVASLYLSDSPYAFTMLRRYIQILRAVVVLFVIIYILNKYSDRMKLSFLEQCGKLSLEIYLVHVCIYEVMNKIDIKYEKIFMFFIYVGLTAVLVKTLHKWNEIITNKLFHNV